MLSSINKDFIIIIIIWNSSTCISIIEYAINRTIDTVSGLRIDLLSMRANLKRFRRSIHTLPTDKNFDLQQIRFSIHTKTQHGPLCSLYIIKKIC